MPAVPAVQDRQNIVFYSNLDLMQDLIYQGEGVLPVLRLLLLYCAVHGGIPKRHYDNLRCVGRLGM